MLYEIKNVKSYENEPRRRWFFEHDIDLTVWFDDNSRIIGFQLCYDKQDSPHALTWRENSGFLHHEIDDGENPGSFGHKGIPILMMDGVFDKEKIARLFQKKSKEIAPEIAEFVYDKLFQYPK